MWPRIEVFQIFAKRFTKFTVLKEKPSKGYMWFRGETDNNSCSYQTWECVAWSMDQNWKSRSNDRKARMGQSGGQNSITLEGWEVCLLLIRKMENIEKLSKNARRKLEVPMDAAMPCEKGTKKHFPKFQKQSMHVSWRRMSPRDNGWNHLHRKIIKITSQAKGYN